MTNRSSGIWMRAPAAAVVIAALAGCADLGRAVAVTPAAVNPESPIANYVNVASRRNYPYPRFRDVPPRPSDIPSPDVYKGEVMGMIGQRRDIKGWAAEHPALVTDTDAYQARELGLVQAGRPGPVPASQAQATEDYAAKLRQEAQAPARPQ